MNTSKAPLGHKKGQMTKKTSAAEITKNIWRINTPVDVLGGFSFNQYLLVDDESLLFHTGLKAHFADIKEAVENIINLSTLKYIAFSHFEGDECGSLNQWLEAAPNAIPVCSEIAAMTSVDDMALRAAHGLADGDTLNLGQHSVKWIQTPHLPHGWETGYLFETETKTLFCGDLFTQPGFGESPVVETDILEISEDFRKPMDYFSHTSNCEALIEKLACENPVLLAAMHGSAWRGDGASLLRKLGKRLVNTN